ncbi:MAG: hypothetical protein AAF431_11245 [Pseudomonadota bacterium]
MKNITTSLIVILGIWATSVSAGEFRAGSMAEGAPPELQHWGKLVGQWTTTEESLKRDGSGWQSSKGADWDFFWAYDGWGIQDNYTSPSMSYELEDESTRVRGTNLRIYNTKEKKWILTWLTPTSTEPNSFTALSTDEEVVMLNEKPNAQGNYSRITFFDMTEETFEWKLEWSKDQENWLEVYRIHGRKKAS